MRPRHAIGVTAAVAVITSCSLLPFLPGRFDNLAVPLSAMARIVGTAGLILVPFGVLRLVVERSPRFSRWRFSAALLALIATMPVWGLVFLMAAVHSGFALGAVVLVAAAYATRRGWTTLSRLRRGLPDGRHVVPIYLTVVPLVVAVLQFALMERAVEFSRARAMRNAAPLITAIEAYRAANGRYPSSLEAVQADDSPGVIGIERYAYAPRGDTYELAFEQYAGVRGTREVVVYNPRDEPHWKYFRADVGHGFSRAGAAEAVPCKYGGQDAQAVAPEPGVANVCVDSNSAVA